MAEEIKDRRLVFYIDSIVRQPFSRPIDPENKPMYPNSYENIVKKGDMLCKAVLVDQAGEYSGKYDVQPYFKIGTDNSVNYDDFKQEFKANCYGFAHINDKRKIVVHPLIYTSKSKLVGYMYIFKSKNNTLPTLAEIKETMQIAGVRYPIDDNKIQAQLNKIKQNENLIGTRILVAQGKKPKDGQIEHVVLLKQKEDKIGTLREDGSMDFKNKSFITKVDIGEPICELKPRLEPQEGYTIYGEPIPGKMLGKKKFKLGTGLVPSKEKPNIYVSEFEGALDINSRKKVSIENKVEVKSDVDLNTGNLNINGSILIHGTIKPGFEVKATRNIIIGKSIEDAHVEAGGDIIVSHGILAKDKEACTIIAEGNVETKFIQHATIKAKGTVKVKESIIQSDVFSKEMVIVGANVIGGTILGKNGLDIGTAGSSSFQKTVLITGKDPDVEEKIQELDKEIKHISETYKEHIDDMKMQFGENFLHNITNFAKGLIGARKLKFVEMLKKLKEFNTQINEATTKREELKENIEFPRPPTIKITEKIYPEVFLQIKNSKKKVELETDSTTYREDPELKCII